MTSAFDVPHDSINDGFDDEILFPTRIAAEPCQSTPGQARYLP